MSDLFRAIKADCQRFGLKPPSYNTVHARLLSRPKRGYPAPDRRSRRASPVVGGAVSREHRTPQQIPSIDRPSLTDQRRPSSAGLAETGVVEFGTVPTALRQVSCARVSGALKISVHAGKRGGEPGRAHRA